MFATSMNDIVNSALVGRILVNTENGKIYNQKIREVNLIYGVSPEDAARAEEYVKHPFAHIEVPDNDSTNYPTDEIEETGEEILARIQGEIIDNPPQTSGMILILEDSTEVFVESHEDINLQ